MRRLLVKLALCAAAIRSLSNDLLSSPPALLRPERLG